MKKTLLIISLYSLVPINLSLDKLGSVSLPGGISSVFNWTERNCLVFVLTDHQNGNILIRNNWFGQFFRSWSDTNHQTNSGWCQLVLDDIQPITVIPNYFWLIMSIMTKFCLIAVVYYYWFNWYNQSELVVILNHTINLKPN